MTRNDGSINYNSFQVTFEKRARSGLNVVSTYTFSKQIEEWGFNDVAEGHHAARSVFGGSSAPLHRRDGLPVAVREGQKLFKSSNGFLGRIVSGWQMNLILNGNRAVRGT